MADSSQLTSWFETTKGQVPLPLTGPSITLSPIDKVPTIFLFGGKLVTLRRLTNVMWALDLKTRTWTRIDTGSVGPGPRYFHSMDVYRDKLVCFGGMSDADQLHVHNDIWFFDCNTRKWLPQPSPSNGLGLGIPDGLPSTVQQDPKLIPQARYAHLSAISRGHLMVSGGQRADNTWIYEMNAYDLSKGVWVSRTAQPESRGLHSKGAYRSVAASSPLRVVVPDSRDSVTGSVPLPYSVEEDGQGGDVWCYSNYDFAKVRRELEVITPMDTDDETTLPPSQSDRFSSPPGFQVHDLSTKMAGSSQPPGLRFPVGGIIGHHFILCGLYLASTSAAFSVWALDLLTMQWRHIEPSVLGQGSWNRAVLQPDGARLVVFGNSQSDLATDYGKRAVNLDHIAVIELEAYGIYRAPLLSIPPHIQQMGLNMIDEKLVSDFDVICEDGRRIACSRRILQERWPWFAEQNALMEAKVNEATSDAAAGMALDINAALLGSLSLVRVTPNCLHIPEPLPVCAALIQYFYTLSLSTPLQTRAPVLSALLFLSKQYHIERLRELVVHALHERLTPSIAVGVYEVATLAGEHNLQARALHMIHLAKNGQNGGRNPPRGPGAIRTSGPNTTAGEAPSPPGASGSNVGPASINDGLPSLGPSGGGATDFRNYRQTSGLSQLTLVTSSPPVSPTAPKLTVITPGGTDYGTLIPSPSMSKPSTDTLRVRTPRRPRPDSFTMPEEVKNSRPSEVAAILEPADDPQVAQLLDEIDITKAPLACREPSSSPQAPAVGSGSARHSAIPPLLPPPDRPLPVPANGLEHGLSAPVTPRESVRASSPTCSEATSSACPHTPSESHRGSEIFPGEQSPSAPSVSSFPSDRRFSITGTPGKSHALAALPENEVVMVDSGSDHSRGSTDSSLVQSLSGQQWTSLQALKGRPRASSGATLGRAASLSSLSAGRPRSMIGLVTPPRDRDSSRIHPVQRRGTIPVVAESGSHFSSEMDQGSGSDDDLDSTGGLYPAHSSSRAIGYQENYSNKQQLWSKRASTIGISSLAAHNISIHTTSDSAERERLMQFQQLLVEQQRRAGVSTAEAEAQARRAVGGGSTPRKGKLGRLGAKILNSNWELSL